jgi:predicted thioesterase
MAKHKKPVKVGEAVAIDVTTGEVVGTGTIYALRVSREEARDLEADARRRAHNAAREQAYRDRN